MRELTIFAKKRTTKDGKKTFFSYLTKMMKKSGEEIICSVKFREECGAPDGKECPCIIEVPDGKCNFSTGKYVDEASGVEIPTYTLWVSDWKNGRPFVDTSMDDFA